MNSFLDLKPGLLLVLVCVLSGAALAQTTAQDKVPPSTALAGQSAQMDVLGAPRGQTLVAGRIAADFVGLAGSEENAIKLVQALRSGTKITLTSAAPTSGGTGGTGNTPGTGSEVVFTPPTGKMGWGNVFISLALAKNALTQAGITDPTAADLQAALVGGDIVAGDGKTVSLAGILNQRASGLGWGQIAQSYDTKLGPIVSSIKSANQRIATVPAASTNTVKQSTQSTATAEALGATARTRPPSLPTGTASTRGVVSAAGTLSGAAGHAKGHVGISTADGTTVRTAPVKGLTTAAGASVGGNAGITSAEGGKSNGHGHAFGRGVVTAAGTAAGTNVASMAGAKGATTVGITAATGASVSTGPGMVATAIGPGAGKGHGNGNGNGRGKGD